MIDEPRIARLEAGCFCRFCRFCFFSPTAQGSSAQNSSGVHWCRRRVRFNEVPEKVPERFSKVSKKVPEKVGDRARSGSTGFRRRFRRRFREALVQSQVRFNRVPEKVPEKGYCAEPCQVQQRFGEGSGEVGGLGAEPR